MGRTIAAPERRIVQLVATDDGRMHYQLACAHVGVEKPVSDEAAAEFHEITTAFQAGALVTRTCLGCATGDPPAYALGVRLPVLKL